MATYRRTRSTRLLVIALVVASLLTITMDFRGGESGPLATLGRASLAIVAPLQEAVSAIFRPVGSFFRTLASLGSLQSENAALRARLQRLESQRAQILEFKRTIDNLSRQLDLKQRLDLDTRGATVIGESVSNFEWAVIVDRGSGDGVRLNMPVIAAEGLVGRVVRVSPTSSKVMLLIDPDSRVGVRLASTGEHGVVAGRRIDQDLRLDLVDPEVEVEPGEPVLTSGFEGSLFPGGIPVGVVSEVSAPEAGISRRILVRPSVDFSRLDHVLMVLPHADVGELGR